jgi:lantibiotic biosynthesis protein
MTIEMHADLFSMIDAVEIRSPTQFTFRGAVRDIGVQTDRDNLQAAPGVVPLVSVLELDLYWKLYTKPTDPDAVPIADPMARRQLMAALSAANTGQGTWEPGWTIEHVDEHGHVSVRKNGIIFWVPEAGLRVRQGGLKPGQSCRVKVGKESRYWMPGYYVAIGDGVPDEDDATETVEPLVRYYWHLTQEAAVPLMAAATSLLNAAGVPFRLKVLADPGAYRRADAGVLYLNRADERRVGDIIVRIHQCIAAGLRPEVPMLTKQIALGLGLAEDPGGPLSFGQHRCKLAATAMWRSYVNGELERDRRAETLAAVFSEAGLQPMRPYLEPGADDHYALPATSEASDCSDALTSVMLSPLEMQSSSQASDGAIPLLEGAIRIGEKLCDDAVWDVMGCLCNWMGRPTSRDDGPEAEATLISSALGPDLYAGSAGVALFLAQLYHETGDVRFRRTAEGAIARSIRQLRRQPTASRQSAVSFYCGHLGVAFASGRIAALTADEQLDLEVEWMLAEVFKAVSAPHNLDLIEGNAGAIPALLLLARRPELARCRDLAIALGEELCRKAVRRDSFWTWERHAVDPATDNPPLTGFAHGAAGIGLAFYELYVATGKPQFLEFARGAFDYEDALFDAARGNWPDLRAPSQPPRFTVAWCNGAPGIALARLRAAALDPARAEAYLGKARVAIETTLAAIDTSLEERHCDTSLCHGLAGLGEVVLIAGQMLDDSGYRERSLAVAQTLLRRHTEPADWESGASLGGPNPSLMLGLAGVGYWLLRQHDPVRVPSILLLTPQAPEAALDNAARLA